MTSKSSKKIDEALNGAHQKTITRQIHFQPAKHSDRNYSELRSQFVPLNSPLYQSKSQPALPHSRSHPSSKPHSSHPSHSHSQKDSSSSSSSSSSSTTTTPSSSSSSSSSSSQLSTPHPLSLIPTDQYLFPPELTLRYASSPPPPSPAGAGLRNLGNTCFLNATLQCLTYLPPLHNLLRSRRHSSRCPAQGFCVLCAFERHALLALSTPSSRPVSPDAFARNVAQFGLRRGRQEDAYEFLGGILSKMQQAAKPPGVRDASPLASTSCVSQLLGGYFLGEVQCALCGHASRKYDPFLDVSLEILGRGVGSVQGALDAFCALERLDEDNKYRCDRCGKHSRATRRMGFARLPPVLVVHLKRFNNLGRKVNKHVAVSQSLRVIQDNSSSTLNSNSNLKSNVVPYELTAMVVHSGASSHCGHYYAYVRSFGKVWHRMDDTRVSQVGFRSVEQEQPYLLFYTLPPHLAESVLSAPQLPQSAGQKGSNQSKTGAPDQPAASQAPKNASAKTASPSPAAPPPASAKSALQKRSGTIETTASDDPLSLLDDNAVPPKRKPSKPLIATDPGWLVEDVALMAPAEVTSPWLGPSWTVTPLETPKVSSSSSSSLSSISISTSASSSSVKSSTSTSPALAQMKRADKKQVQRESFSAFVSETVQEQRKGQFAQPVAAWESHSESRVVQQQILRTAPELKPQFRKRDQHDVEYDAGRLKKVGRHIDPFASRSDVNPYQQVQNKRTEHPQASYSSHKPHNKQHKQKMQRRH